MNVMNTVTRFATKTAMKVGKVSPHLMLGVGVAGVVVGVVLACKETRKAQEVIDETSEQLDNLASERIPDAIVRKESFKIYMKNGGKLIKIYAPAIALEAASLSLIIGSHCILNRRYIATAAAYKAVEEAFRGYRKTIKEKLGEDEEKRAYLSLSEPKKDIPVTQVDPETGEVIITPENGVIIDPNFNASPYAKFFDELNPNWKKNPEYNLMFLRSQQNYLNDVLHTRGHVFLNEAYEALGFPHTSAGAVVGWVLGAGDDCIDFGLYDAYRESARDFVNGYERSVLLDFNVDGLIWDKI